VKDFSRVVPCAEESEAAQFIAQVVGSSVEHIDMILNAAPTKDREDLIHMAEALQRIRERRHGL